MAASADVRSARHELSERGYWVGPILFDADDVARLRREVERVHRGDLDGDAAYVIGGVLGTDRPGGATTVLYGWRVNDAIRAAVTHPRLGALAAELLDVPRVRLWQDQVISKPPGEGGTIGFHQDYEYWQDVSTSELVTANVALQDTDESNGALHVLAGSHRLGLVDWVGDFFDTRLQRPEVDVEEVVLPLRAGQVSFHHSLTVHGSGPNTGSEPRMTLAPAYVGDGASYCAHGGRPSPHSSLLGRAADGDPYAGDAFPLVHPRGG